MQIVHRLHRDQDREIQFGPILGIFQAHVQLVAASDDVGDDAVDCVLIRPGRLGDDAADVLADRVNEA